MRRYPKILSLGHELVATIFDNPVELTEKIDGCFEYGMSVKTDHGDISIGKIVNNKLNVQILSYNINTGKTEYKKILNYHKENTDTFIRIGVESRRNGNRKKYIICTPNHLLYSNNEWIAAKEIKIGDNLSHYSDSLSIETEQIILGMLIGDGSIHRISDKSRGIAWGQSLIHNRYVDNILDITGNLFVENKSQISGYGSTMRRLRINANQNVTDLIHKYCERDGKKTITSEWVDHMMPIGIAFWYMDDGSCTFTDKQRPRAKFSTNGFTYEEVTLLSNMFKIKFDINTTINDYKGWTLTLSADSTERLFTLISPYILPGMRYKLSEKYENSVCHLEREMFDSTPSIINTNVISITDKLTETMENMGRTKYQYDLTVEDNHNYFVQQVLVHNSQCRINLTEDHVSCGSKNVGIADEKSFRLAHLQAERIHKEKMWEGWGADVTLFCEFLSKEKHNVLKYDRVPFNNLYLFGAIVNDKHLTTDMLILLAHDLDIEPPAVLASKKEIKSQNELEEYLTITSVLGGTILEGIVIKNYHQSYPPLLTSTQAFFGYPLAGKIVRDDFKERLNKEWKDKKVKESPIERLTTEFLTEPRFLKTVQHMRDEGELVGEMKDMKVLIPEFYQDLMDEERDEICKILMADIARQLKKRCDSFVVQSYKHYLIEKQFKED